LTPPHLSIYDLIVDPGKPCSALRQSVARCQLPDSDSALTLMALTSQRLKAAGYGPLQISNYGQARPCFKRHNRVYGAGQAWWGFGLGATSAPYGRAIGQAYEPGPPNGEWLKRSTNRATSQAEPGRRQPHA